MQALMGHSGLEVGEGLRGIVIRSTGSWYDVLSGDTRFSCRARGRIRLKEVRSTNPIAVGDAVLFVPEGPDVGVITAIEPRRNYMIRRATNLSRESHIIAANLDLAAVVVTLVAPPTPLEFVDRYLATAQAYGIPQLVILNKQDLPEEQDEATSLGIRAIYENAGATVVELSASTGLGLERLRTLLKGKTTLLAGHSGTGKSSILNALEPTLALRTAPLSESHGLGQHTTTFAEMYPLTIAPNTYVIDTPGIKGFGVIDFDRHEVSHFFPEIFTTGKQCKYPDCLHYTEPGCAVVSAVECGHIPYSRYQSYLSILCDEGGKYR